MSLSTAEMEAQQDAALDRGDLQQADMWQAQLDHADQMAMRSDDQEMER